MAKRLAGVKTGRRAGKDEREMALRLVKVYRLAMGSPDGRLCLNPGDDPKKQTFIDALNPNLLIWALENFSEHGTFHFIDQIVGQRFRDELQLREEFEELRSKGATYEDAVENLVTSHGKSKSTIERKINLVHGPLTKVWFLPSNRDTD